MMKFYQTLTGVVDGANTVFFTVDVFVSDTVRYFLNGLEYEPGVDYFVNTALRRISLVTVVPEPGDLHWAHFQVL